MTVYYINHRFDIFTGFERPDDNRIITIQVSHSDNFIVLFMFYIPLLRKT